MDKKLTWVEVLLLLACFAAAFAVIGMAFAHFTHEVDKDKIGDAATWVGAIFTASAFAGTIWIATSSETRRRDAMRVQATIAMPALTGYLVDMQVHTEAVEVGMEHWISAIDADRTDENWKELVQLTQQYAARIPQIPGSYLIDFADISKKVAGDINKAQSQVRAILTFLAAMNTTMADRRDEEAKFAAGLCNKCAKTIVQCKERIESLWKEHGFDEG